MIKLAMSGLQTGVDYHGLKAAKDSGIPTTGWMPKGWLTQDGPRPEYEKEFNAKEHFSTGYKQRTWKNVEDSEGTLRFALDFDSAGEICTKNAIDYYGREFYDVKINRFFAFAFVGRDIEYLYIDDPFYHLRHIPQWIKESNIEILNIAGNSEKTAPGIGEVVYEFCCRLFREMKND